MNIGEIIGEYIYLKPLGEDFVGRCPFCLHPQQNMVVITSLQIYECLHCRQTGGPVHFVKHIENIIKWDFRRSAKRIVKHTTGIVYILQLEDNCYYIGFTQNLPQRLSQHFAHKGALWTRKHPPIKLVDVYYDVPEFVEHRVTKRYLERYGAEKVRGGNYVDARDRPGIYQRYPKRLFHKGGANLVSLKMK
ncbi:CHC2 zinc finger domain-containing protein [Mucilaginibacter segetis]|uniref:GIY-YIG nuclease family protein n=1 Tax=Mucilaginibacter segetis TaxID=2793071 RepID=A0A934UM78_9SPHI|nr:CHC2 zinc finger domain-containing protein [Mucilaginibacter segetis]MBK0379358.1 GIY-YIG nuclease family protein [Mucilaginibacter segetis]